jgi:GntR family transcriptional regulator / MocR family aminotransferase
VVPSAAGLHVTTLLRDRSASDVALADAALTSGVFVDTLSTRHRGSSPRHGLAFGLGGVAVADIEPAVGLLRRSLEAGPQAGLTPSPRSRPVDG